MQREAGSPSAARRLADDCGAYSAGNALILPLPGSRTNTEAR